ITELSLPLGVSFEELTPVEKEENSLEGSSVTLSYRYLEMSLGDYFFWYRQYPGKPPEFLISHSASGQEGNNNVIPGLKIKLSDSAVYYCALQPTVTGNTKTLWNFGCGLFLLLFSLVRYEYVFSLSIFHN
uniref:Ig-like domain-containing protein n=1 Tax=Sander lucioperca TaxID=283035 RepID=A0A8C9ZTZ4_SANLU